MPADGLWDVYAQPEIDLSSSTGRERTLSHQGGSRVPLEFHPLAGVASVTTELERWERKHYAVDSRKHSDTDPNKGTREPEFRIAPQIEIDNGRAEIPCYQSCNYTYHEP